MKLLLLLLAGLAAAHPVGKNDKLKWRTGCDINYTDGDKWERLQPQRCDYLEANSLDQQQRFNTQFSLTQQRAFLMRNDDAADAAFAKFKREQPALLKKADPKTFEALKPNARSVAIMQALKTLEQEAPPLTRPFGNLPKYTKDFELRIDDLHAALRDTEKDVDEEHRKLIQETQGKFESGQASGLKKAGEALAKDGDGMSIGRKLFEKDLTQGNADGGAGQGTARADDPTGGGQLAKGAGMASGAEQRYSGIKDIPQHHEARGTAGQNRGVIASGAGWLRQKAGLSEPAPDVYKQFARERVTAAPGVSKEAHREAVRLVEARYKDTDPRIVQNMMDNNVEIVITPKGADLGQYAPELKNTWSLDRKRCFSQCVDPNTGRTIPGNIRGVADVALRNGNVGVLIPEENLVGDGRLDERGFPKGSTSIHEIAHAELRYGVPQTTTWKEDVGLSARKLPTQTEIETLFAQTRNRSGIDDYGKTDADEYYAQFATAWAGKHDEVTAEKLRRTDPKMYAYFESVHGPPKTI